MTASSLPFHLRPRKAVDRRLFVDLLARFERWRPISNYAYISMGAYALEDHRMVHHRFGISRLVSFDREANTVARQHFNRPIGSCCCLPLDSGQVVDRIDQILEDSVEENPDGVVIWLDYTSPRQLGQQIREFQTLLCRLAEGDVVRITVNANATALGSSQDSAGRQLVRAEVLEKRFRRLSERVGNFLPSNASPGDVEQKQLPLLLARTFGQAAMKIVPPLSENMFSPLSIISYADGQQMLSITGALVKRDSEQEMRSAMDLENWPFKSSNWESMASLIVPHLTIRERMFLEREIEETPQAITKKLGFDLGDDIDLTAFVEQYRAYYRFYPSLVAVEV